MVLTYKDIEEYRNNGMTWRQIGEHLASITGLDAQNLSNTARLAYRRRGKTVLNPIKDGVLSVRNTELTNGDMTSERKSTFIPDASDEKSLLRYHGYDPTVWHVKESVSSVRNDQWTSRIKVTPRKYTDVPTEQIEIAVRNAFAKIPNPQEMSVEYSEDEFRYAVLPLYDVHFGKRLVMDGVTYDHNDTKEVMLDVTRQFTNRCVQSGVNRIVIVIGQDFLNSDNIEGATTNGTRQDNSLPWHEMVAQGIALLAEIIESCRGIAPIDVIYSEGNHDKVLSFCIAQALKQRYLTCDDITVDARQEPRKYDACGETLIGFTHGNEETKLASVMQNEEPLMWGEAKYRYWITGHVHHLEMYDADGVTIIKCPSPTFSDEWLKRKGYINATRAQSAFLFGTYGMEAMWLFTI